MTNSHPCPSAFAHAVFRTNTAQSDKMIKFYKRLLNAEIVSESESIVFLRYDEEHHRIAILRSPEFQPSRTDGPTTGLDHIAYTYPTLTDLSKVYVSMKTGPDPVYPILSINHGPTTSLYYRDPGGNKIECQVDNFDTPKEADDFLSGSLFAENPIGTDFDPEEWSAYILSHATEDGKEGLPPDLSRELKKRKEIGVRQDIPKGFV